MLGHRPFFVFGESVTRCNQLNAGEGIKRQEMAGEGIKGRDGGGEGINASQVKSEK